MSINSVAGMSAKNKLLEIKFGVKRAPFPVRNYLNRHW